jgi:hypothetical protein
MEYITTNNRRACADFNHVVGKNLYVSEQLNMTL